MKDPLLRDTDTAFDVYKEALTYCHSRRAVLLVDAESDWTAANAAQPPTLHLHPVVTSAEQLARTITHGRTIHH